MFEDRLEIIENTPEAKTTFGYCYGSFLIQLTREQVEALLCGKAVAATINDEEYSIFITCNS